ncbi:MAG: DUF3810 domain-containing protein [Sediminicola sp.]
MNRRLRNAVALSLIPQIIVVKLLARAPESVERFYSLGFYPVISLFLRTLLGWLPFSAGDILYTALVVLLVRHLYLKGKEIFRKPLPFLRDIIMVLSIAYFCFHLLWGLNYYREPLSKTLSLRDTNTQLELELFTEKLVRRTNEAQFSLTADSSLAVRVPYSQKQVRAMTIEGYAALERIYPQFAYDRPSLKNSLFSTALTYMGYGGYLNPFTNEAQVNGLLPNFRYPVVCGHEAGHQIGYSAENETNFIGYLVTIQNSDPYFKYAGYAYALGYCLYEIKRRDEAAFERLLAQLNTGVKKNYQEMADFWLAHENPAEPIFKEIFNTFLKANNQSKGILSYNSVVSLLVSYHEKHPL